jgi:hypothetical protein
MHNTCRYGGADTVMVKGRKSGRWHSCSVGTRQHHRCKHWPSREAPSKSWRFRRRSSAPVRDFRRTVRLDASRERVGDRSVDETDVTVAVSREKNVPTSWMLHRPVVEGVALSALQPTRTRSAAKDHNGD